MYKPLVPLAGGVALALPLLLPTTAHAGIDACGDIQLEADAECELTATGGCQATCEDARFEAACAAELYANCEGQCNAEISADCTTRCDADCLADCEVDPGMFDCRAGCFADCSGVCDAECEAAADQAECRASCEGTCSAECDARCEATPPMADCETKCSAVCEGSCDARANATCQIDCQAEGYATCKADLQVDCEAQCEEFDGALICDGQYVDHGGKLEECVDALRALLNIEVEGYAEGECRGNTCEGEAGGSISCASTVAPVEGYDRETAMLMGVLGFGLYFSARRRLPS